MPQHQPPASAPALLREADRLMASEAYRTAGHPDRQKVAETVERLFKVVYGDGQPLHDAELSAPAGPAEAVKL